MRLEYVAHLDRGEILTWSDRQTQAREAQTRSTRRSTGRRRTYLTGFLVPREDRNVDPLSDPDDDTEAEEAEADGEEEVGAG